MFGEFWAEFLDWLPALLVLLDGLVAVLAIAWVLMTKSNSTSAVAWCLGILFLPFLGALLFFFFGWQHVHRPLRRKRRHKQSYRGPTRFSVASLEAPDPARSPAEMASIERLSRLAQRFGAAPPSAGNHLEFHFEGAPSFEAMRRAIAGARHHIHLEFFIWQPDGLGREFLELLAGKAREGVIVRLLYDAMGSYRLPASFLRDFHAAGGKSSVFLPLNPLRRRLQVNMRNHRKILVVDGAVGFTGGLNIGDEYLSLSPRFGYWRDTHLLIRGPAVWDLQRIFLEDWSFAAEENVAAGEHPEAERPYFPPPRADGGYRVQVLESGPDRDLKGIRELTFAAILAARRRLWIASPYFVPDEGLLDALRLAGHMGVDVRLVLQDQPDKWIPQYAARYYWEDMLRAGVRIYQYARGMMHAKVLLVDEDFASVGTANLDNRSMFLNFEVNCLIHSAAAVRELERSFLQDFSDSILLDRRVWAQRPFGVRLVENACRLLSPIL